METLIFFKIRFVLKKYQTEAVFTKIKMNNEWNIHFFQNTTVVLKKYRN